jgi:PAS domain S-box-containing protein
MSTTQPASTPIVRHFMSQVLFTLENDLSLVETAQFFHSHKLTTVPVLKKNGEILGVLTDFQLLRCLIRAKGANPQAKIGDFESELDPVVTIQESESIVNAFRLMIQSPNHRIYAVNAEDKLTGALSPKDLLLYTAGVTKETGHVIDDIVQKQIESILKELHDTRRMLSDYQQMFHDAPYLMHSVDMSGNIIAANRMLHFVLGYEDGELIGKSIKELYPPENHKKAMKGLDTVKALGFHPLVNVTFIKKDGDQIRADIASTLKKDAKGNPEGTITVGRLSDSYRMLDYLQKAVNEHAKLAAAAASKPTAPKRRSS